MFFHIPGSNGEPKIWPSATTILIKSSQSQAKGKKVTEFTFDRLHLDRCIPSLSLSLSITLPFP